jgi:hypothetical protein
MSPTAEKICVVVTKAELLELAEWETKYAAANKKVAEAKKEVEFRRQALAEKVLGVKSSDELKQLDPAKLQKLQLKRYTDGEWKVERNAPLFVFTKTSSGQYPAWKQIYTNEHGETAANQIAAEAPLVYSYKVEVVVA